MAAKVYQGLGAEVKPRKADDNLLGASRSLLRMIACAYHPSVT